MDRSSGVDPHVPTEDQRTTPTVACCTGCSPASVASGSGVAPCLDRYAGRARVRVGRGRRSRGEGMAVVNDQSGTEEFDPFEAFGRTHGAGVVRDPYPRFAELR